MYVNPAAVPMLMREVIKMRKLIVRRFLCVLILIGSCLVWQNLQVDAASNNNEKLVVVKGTIYKGKAPIVKGTLTTYSKTTNKAYQSSIKNGAFQLSVPVGEYRIDTYSDSMKQTVGNIYQSFSVLNGKPTPIVKIQLKEDNIKGSIHPLNGKITDGTLYVTKHDQNAWNYVTVLRNNQFQMALADGTYTAFQYYDKGKDQFGQLNTTFTVKNGKLTTSSLKMKAPAMNVSGTVQLKSKQAVKGTIKIECQTCVRSTAYTASVKNGKYEASLPNGKYKISTIYNHATKKTKKYSFVFEIRSAKLAAPKSAMALVMDESDNQKGIIVKGGKPIQNGYLFIHPSSSEGYFYYPAIQNGKFTTYLKDGTYSIDGYFDENQQQNVPLEQPVKLVVSGGKSNASNLNIQLKADNFIGTVHKAGKAIKKGTIYAKNDQFTRVISIINGKFTAYLADGTYTIQKARDDIAYLDYEFEPITVKVEEGKLISSQSLQIHILEDNVSGIFTTSSGVVKSGAFYVHDKNGRDFKFPITDGHFSMHLPDGIYTIGTIFDYSGGNKVVDYTFTVKDGKLLGESSLLIKIKDDNVTGQVTIGGSPAARGFVRITGAKGGFYTSEVINGRFSILLPDGEYKITEFENVSTQQKLSLSIKFIVTGGITSPIEITIPGDNFSGMIIKSGQPIKLGAVVLYSVMGNHHTVDLIDNHYSGHLPDGMYRVISVVDRSTNLRYELSIEVTVVDGKLVNPVSIVVHEHNVKITVENAVKLATGRLVLKDAAGKVNSFEVQEGRIGVYLPDSDYHITSFHTESGTQIPLRIPFTVKEGKANPELLAIKLPENNIFGTVTKAGKSVEKGYLLVTGNLASYSIPISSGKISTHLPDGEYKITQSYDGNLYKESQEDIAFTVSDGKPSIAPFAIVLKEDSLQGLLKLGVAPAQDGSLYVLTKDDSKSYHFTVRNGEFSGSLPDGEYKVVQYYSYNGMVARKLSHEFTIADGKLTVPLVITLPDNNFIGTVDKNGEIIKFGYITIEITSKMEVFDVRLNDGKFSDYLADGDYMIKSVYSSTSSYHHEKIHFEVKNGQISISTAIKLKDNNVTGTVTKNNNGITGSIRISQENGGIANNFMISQGTLNTYLPDGTYQILNIWSQDGTEEKFDISSFEVKDGKLVGTLEIHLQ
jgi:hypothetical protein